MSSISNQLKANRSNKSNRPTIGRGLPPNSFGAEGDISLRIIGNDIKLLIKAKGKWHGVKIGESFDRLEREINSIRKDLSNAFVNQEIDSFHAHNRITSSTSNLKDFGSKTAPLAASGQGVLYVVDDILKFASDAPLIYNLGVPTTGDYTVDVAGDIILNADGGQVTIKDDTANHFLFDCDATSLTIYDDTDVADLFSITVGASGASTIATVDDGAAIGHLTLTPDGDLILDPVSQKVIINATDALYLDGGGDTYIYEASADAVRYVVGGDILMTMIEKGNDGNTVEFRDSAVGFQRDEATFSATGVIGSGGSDDTDIDFRFSNKFRLEMTADIHTMNLIFPPTSGNFLLVCTTDGDHDVSNWKVFESDESAATTADVMWAGGSVPAFTSSGVDIVSFYWDANDKQAYGTASLAFATP